MREAATRRPIRPPSSARAPMPPTSHRSRPVNGSWRTLVSAGAEASSAPRTPPLLLLVVAGLVAARWVSVAPSTPPCGCSVVLVTGAVSGADVVAGLVSVAARTPPAVGAVVIAGAVVAGAVVAGAVVAGAVVAGAVVAG